VKQYKVIYQINSQVREKLFLCDTPFEAGIACLRAYPGVLPSSIIDVVDVTPVTVKRRAASLEGKSRKFLTLSPEKRARLILKLRNDPNFSMPISAAPDQEDTVTDEITNADEGLTIASSQKLFPSHDIVFSADPKIDEILEGSGGQAIPFFNSKVLRLFKGPRKAMYNLLLDAGFKPTRMGM